MKVYVTPEPEDLVRAVELFFEEMQMQPTAEARSSLLLLLENAMGPGYQIEITPLRGSPPTEGKGNSNGTSDDDEKGRVPTCDTGTGASGDEADSDSEEFETSPTPSMEEIIRENNRLLIERGEKKRIRDHSY